MAETHELRLRINAAAARAGSREFVGAIEHVKRAVLELERTSDGAFKRLSKNAKDAAKAAKVNISPVNRSTLRDMDRFIRTQSQIIRKNAASRRGISGLLEGLSNVASGYVNAKSTGDAYANTLLRMNVALARQGQLIKTTATPIAARPARPTSGGTDPTIARKSDALDRQRNLAVSIAAAMRKATEETARLSERMRRLGDVRGIAELNTSLNVFRSQVGSGINSASRLRVAVSQFGDSASKAKLSLIQMEGAKRRSSEAARVLAARERDASSEARRLEREMRSVAGASSAVTQAFRRATGSMRGLENAFSGTYQIGSAFRVLLGTITFGTFIREMYQAGATLQQFRVTMEVATGSIQGAVAQMDFVDGMARTLGTSLRTARDDFSKFAVSASLAGVETATARDIFRSISQAMTVMGRGAEDQRLAFLALEQMLSKNVVSSEELRRQLGERLPGAVNLMARAVGVSTQELNKLLKAGALISSEVLPKFAREVDAAFGPGLSASLERAPAALGRFRNELEFFMASVADGGFMDAMAQGLDALTEALRSEEINAVAKALGAGISDLTQIVVDFSKSFVGNIETIGRVAKAVIGGLIVRQAILMGNALITSSSKFLIAFNQLSASMQANTASIQTNNAAMTGNSQIRRLSTTQISAESAAMGVNTLEQGLNTASANANTVAQTRLGRAFTFAGGSAAAAGRRLTAMSVIFSGLAGPLGLAITSLSLIPVLFSDTGNAADEMARRLDAAIRRSGASLEKFERQAAKATSSMRLLQTLNDIRTLEDAVSNFRRTSESDIKALSEAFRLLDQNLTLEFNRAAPQTQILESLFGTDAVLALNNISSATKSTIKDVMDAALQAINTGRGFVNLREQISKTIALNPSTESLLRPLMDMTETLYLAEAGTARLRMGLVDVYGTADERLIKSFADTALSVVKTGDGVDDLRRRMQSMAADAPHLSKQFAQVFDEVVYALENNIGTDAFAASVITLFDASVNSVESLRDSAANAEASVVSASDGMSKAINNFTETVLTNHAAMRAFGSGVARDIAEISNQVTQFEDFQVSPDRANAVFSGFQFPTEQAKAFSEQIIDLFSALPEGLQTYQQLNNLFAQSTGPHPRGVEEFTDTLRDSLKVSKDTSFGLSDYIDKLEEFRATTTSAAAREHIDNLIRQAEALRVAEVAQQAATHALEDTTAAMRQSAAGTSEATSSLKLFLDLWDKVGKVTEDSQSTLKAAMRTSFEEFDLSRFSGADADVAGYFASFGEGGGLVAEAREQVETLREEFRTFSSTPGAALLPPGALSDLKKQIDDRERQIDRFVRQQGVMLRAQSAGTIDASDSALTKAIMEVTDALPDFSYATQRVVDETLKAAKAASKSGGGFIELRAKIEKALLDTPTARPLLDQLQSVINYFANTEESAAKARISVNGLLDNTYGDRLAGSFARLGARVVTGTASVEKLQEEFDRMVDQAPHLEQRLKAIFVEAMKALESGDEALFLSRVVNVVDQAGAQMARLRREAQLTSAAADDAAVRFSNAFRDVTVAITKATSDDVQINTGITDQDIFLLNRATDAFKKLDTATVTIQDVANALESTTFPSRAAREFASELSAQFSALPQAQRNYENFNKLLIEVGESFPEVAATGFADSLRQQVFASSSAGTATAAYIQQLSALRNATPIPELKDYIQRLMDAAERTRDADRAAGEAEGAVRALGNAAALAGTQAASASGMFKSMAEAAASAFGAVANIQAEISTSLSDASNDVLRQIEIAGMSGREAAVAQAQDRLEKQIDAKIRLARSELSDFAPGSAEGAAARSRIAELETERERITEIANLYGVLYDVRQENQGGGGGANDLNEQAAALKTLVDGVKSHVHAMHAQSAAYALLASRTTSSETAAQLLGEAMASGVELTQAQTTAIIEQAEAAELLKEKLQSLANDPVNDWINSVPNWIEAGQKIEVDVLDSLSDSISSFIKTGEFDFRSFASSIVDTAADLLADAWVKQLVSWIGGNTSGDGIGGFGLGAFLGFGNGGGNVPPANMGEGAQVSAGIVSGGQQVAALLEQALIRGGQTAAQSLSASSAASGEIVSQNVQMASIRAGSSISSSMAVGGTTAASQISTQMGASGSTVANQISTKMQTAGAQVAAQIGAATGGAKRSGGFLGGLFGGGGMGPLGAVLGLGGLLMPLMGSTPRTSSVPSSPKKTPNQIYYNPDSLPSPNAGGLTSGAPSGMGGSIGGSPAESASNVSIGDISVTVEGNVSSTEDAQTLAAAVGQQIEMVVDRKLSDGLRYGGRFNPR